MTSVNQDFSEREQTPGSQQFPESSLAGDAREIWDRLVEGKTVRVLATVKSAERLRVRLHQIKTQSEKQMIDIGFIGKDDVVSLLFVKGELDDRDNPDFVPDSMYVYKITLGKRKREPVQFRYTLS